VKIGSEQFLTSSEVGDLLQVNASSVKKWVDDGLLVAFRTPGGHRRIRAADLVQFLDAHKMPIPRHLRDSARRRLLIVDDDLAQLKALARAFKREGERIEVVTTGNGIDALVLVGSFQPHFVLLDVYMPDVDGLEVCKRLKKNPKTQSINVIVVTGHINASIKRKALEAGALDCVAKPIDIDALVNLILSPDRAEPARAE
jgi:excisionase family DNA binding protein